MVTGMNALYPRAAIVCAVLAVCLSCSGRTVQGVWYGDLPATPYRDCRIELQHGGSLKAVCKATETVTVLGSFSLSEETLKLRYVGIDEAGKPVGRGGSEQEFTISGPGNQIRLQSPGLEPVEWERRPQ
jgi:hypothetical protein